MFVAPRLLMFKLGSKARLKKMIKRHTTYCFEAKLKEIGKDTYYVVPFQVLAKNQYVAKTILEEYLKNPEQTGWRYEACVNLMPMPTEQIIVDTNKSSDFLNSKN